MKIETIHNTILQSCTYIIFDDKSDDCFLIDCGDVEPIEDFIKINSKHLRGIFLTHSHYDHIYGLTDVIKNHPDVTVYASSGTIEGLTDPDINLSYMYDDGDYIVEGAKTCDINAHQTNILGVCVQPLSTPGHDIDCTSYIIGKNIFTGDSYNPDFEIFTKWRRSNVYDAQKSIECILELTKQNDLVIHPGHYK